MAKEVLSPPAAFELANVSHLGQVPGVGVVPGVAGDVVVVVVVVVAEYTLVGHSVVPVIDAWT